MERLLSKPRVLLGLCAVLLMAALNRQDPMVYAMFLFLAVISLLGFVLPWLSLRSTTVRLDTATDTDCSLAILVQRSVPWPAFMVDIETEWEHAGQRMVLRQTLPVIRKGHVPDLGRLIQFPCRGRYELMAVRLSSGFPLGLFRAHHTLPRPQIHMRVLPQPQPVQWPLPWDIAEDPQGELTTRRLGQSFELGMLRPYQPGEPLGRVSWRASARVGDLVIQHFQQSGSVRLRVIVEVPSGSSLGDGMGAGEQAIRLAAGVCQAALDNGAQLFLYLEDQVEPVRDASALLGALAEARATEDGYLQAIARAASPATQGEQVAVVVSGTCPAPALQNALEAFAAKDCRVVACIALGRRKNTVERAQAKALQVTLQRQGFATFMEAP